ncbi:MAG: hypothetical protein JNJ54_27565 [Myxococcaceae bacterium]|nr:hypothetical protein [Myxococcaceae bacterium]
MPVLLDLATSARLGFDAPGAGRRLDTAGVEPLESLHDLKDMWWAVYRQDGAWRLHVAAGFEVRLDGRVTGGGALEAGDVVDDGEQWRFLDGEWPGVRDEALDARTTAAPEDDPLALVYRDWALEHGSAIAEALRRPVPRAEQARHLWSLGAAVSRGLIDADFAGPFVRRVVTRQPELELTGFVEALARCAPGLPRLEVVRTLGLSTDDGVQLALLLAREPSLRGVRALEAGQRGAFWLDDFRHEDEASPGEVREVRSPREGPARPVRLEVVEWDGWTAVEPLTTHRSVLLEADVSLISEGEATARLGPWRPDAPVSLRRLDDWVLDVRPPVPPALQPRLAGIPAGSAVGLRVGETFELVPGLGCRLTPAR